MIEEERELTVIETTCDTITKRLGFKVRDDQYREMQAMLRDVLTEEIDIFRNEVRETLYGFDSKIGIRNIIDYVMERYMISFDDIQSNSRKRELVEPRQICHWMIRNKVAYNRLSLDSVGELVGGRDHSTVLHSCRTIDNIIATDRAFRESLMVMCNELGARTKWIPEKKELLVTGYLKTKANETLPTEKTEQEDNA